jgi:hypothetical protein
MKDRDNKLIWESFSSRPSYDKIMRDAEDFDYIAYKYNGFDEPALQAKLMDFEDKLLRIDPEDDNPRMPFHRRQLQQHINVLEDLLDMDEVHRAEATGDGPQYDR